MIAWIMPDALELLTTRRSFKAVELVGPAPSEAEIDTLLTVASRVPDHGKLAPWRFIVFEGEARRSAGEAIAAAFRAKYPDAKPKHIAAERERLVRAPLVIAVVSRARTSGDEKNMKTPKGVAIVILAVGPYCRLGVALTPTHHPA
jgi:nitroreductase